MRDRHAIAKQAALAGGTVLAHRAHDFGIIRSKTSPTDFVSEADVAAGVAVVSTLLESDPGAHVLVEEPEVCELVGIESGALTDSELWIVDPLDGTTSYLHGFPCYSVSVAYVREGLPVAGAVFNVSLQEMVSAEAGNGAFLNESRIRCADAEQVSDALVVTGFPYDRGEPLTRQLAVLSAFLRAPVHGVRRDGSAAIDLCHIASGRADGFWEFGLKPWDMAAGALICTEAGALVTDIAGAPWSTAAESVLAANPVLHSHMLEIIESA